MCACVQDGPVVMGSVTVYPEDIVSSDEIGDGWWKLVPPDKKAQPNFKVHVRPFKSCSKGALV